MPQLSLYLDDQSMEQLRQDASNAHKSLSRFVLDELNERKLSKDWPRNFFSLYGSVSEEDNLMEPLDTPISSNEINALDKE